MIVNKLVEHKSQPRVPSVIYIHCNLRNAVLAQYAELQQQAKNVDAVELDVARQAIRPSKEYKTAQRLQTAYGKQFDSKKMAQSRKDVAGLCGETVKPVSIQSQLQQSYTQSNRWNHKKVQNQEL